MLLGKKQVIDRLGKAVTASKRTHIDICTGIDLTPPKLSRVLSGKRILYIGELLDLCNVLMIRIGWLCGEVKAKRPIEEATEALMTSRTKPPNKKRPKLEKLNAKLDASLREYPHWCDARHASELNCSEKYVAIRRKHIGIPPIKRRGLLNGSE